MALTTTNSNSRPIVTSETSTNTGVAIAIDYTTYYERIATALETIATNSTAIKNSLAAIDTDFDTLKTQLTTIATQSTTIATQQTTMATKLTALEARAADQGIKIVGPWEWLGMSSIVKLYDEKGVDYNALKARVEQIPKGA